MATFVNVTSTGQPLKYSDDKATTFAQFLESLGDDNGVWGRGPDGVDRRPNLLRVGTGGIQSAGPISGPFSNNVTNVTFALSPYTVVATDETIVVDTSGGAVTVNLPAALAANIGRTLYIAKKTSDANAVTIAPSGTDTINAVNANVVLALQLEVANIQVIAAGAWMSIAGDVTIRTVQAIDGPAATNRDLNWTTAGLLRWQLRANSTAEGGANAGSDLNLNAYDDTGALLGAALTIVRSTRAVTIATGLTVTAGGAVVTAGNLLVSGGAVQSNGPGPGIYQGSGTGTGPAYCRFTSTGADTIMGDEGVAGTTVTNSTTNSSIFGSAGANSVHLFTNDIVRLTITSAGAATFTSSVTISTGGLTVTAGGATITAGGLTVSAGGITVTGNSTITGTLGGLTGLTVASGGATITAGGVTVTAGGLIVNGGQLATSVDGAAGLTSGLALTNQTNQAGVSTGTLTNAPAATNPNFWIPVNVNGVLRKVPAW